MLSPLCSLTSSPIGPGEENLTTHGESAVDLPINESYGITLNRIVKCGVDSVVLRDEQDNYKELPSYCDNRICMDEGCNAHRGYQYAKVHAAQIDFMRAKIRKPKAWIFTQPLRDYPITRDVLASERKRLIVILNHPLYGASSPYVLHMEIALHANHWYLHFHVIMGGVKSLKRVRGQYGSVVKYEDAVKREDLERYIGKYASKVPALKDEGMGAEYLIHYGSVVYKLEMHTFSDGPKAVARAGFIKYSKRNFYFMGVRRNDETIRTTGKLGWMYGWWYKNIHFAGHKGTPPPIVAFKMHLPPLQTVLDVDVHEGREGYEYIPKTSKSGSHAYVSFKNHKDNQHLSD